MGVTNSKGSGAQGNPSLSEDVVLNILGVVGSKDGDVVAGGGCGGGSGSVCSTNGGGGTTTVGPRPCHSLGSLESVLSHVPQSKRCPHLQWCSCVNWRKPIAPDVGSSPGCPDAHDAF